MVIKRGITNLLTINPERGSEYTASVMGDEFVRLKFRSRTAYVFLYNDYIEYNSVVYKLKSPREHTRVIDGWWEYDLRFEGSYYELKECDLFNFDSNSTVIYQPKFNITSEPLTVVQLLVNNLNRNQSGWTVGTVLTAGAKTISFDSANCYDALKQIADAFDTEFSVYNKVVSLGKVMQTNTPLVLEQGFEKGLTNLQLSSTSTKDALYTRLYAFGAERNIGDDYRTRYLHESAMRDRAGQLMTVSPSWTFAKAGVAVDMYFLWYGVLTIKVRDNNFYVTDGKKPVRVLIKDGETTKLELYSADAGAYTFVEWVPDLSAFGTSTFDATISVLEYDNGVEVEVASCSLRYIYDPAFVNVATRVYDGMPFYNPIAIQQLSKRLLLPFNEGAASVAEANQLYISKNENIYGVIEKVKNFDDIYPRLKYNGVGTPGSITETDINPSTRTYKFSDQYLDFNLTDQLLQGLTAQVVFITGELAGLTFDVQAWDNATKQVTLKLSSDDLPKDALIPQVGDQYAFSNIVMPNSYILAAEQELLVAAQAELNKQADMAVDYTPTLDRLYLKRNDIELSLGLQVEVASVELGVDEVSRITQLTKSLTDEYLYSNVKFSNQQAKSSLTSLALKVGNNSTLSQSAQAAATAALRSANTQNAAAISIDSSSFSGNLDPTVTNVQLLADAVDVLVTGSQPLEKRYDSVTPYRYMGTAANGSLETASVWTITRMLVSANGSITTASATNVKWTDRLTITYI